MKRNHADRLGTAAPDDPFLAVKQLSRASFRILILSFLELDHEGHGNYRLSRRPSGRHVLGRSVLARKPR